MKASQREYVMGLLVSMMVHDRAGRESRPFVDVFSEFRRSRTYQNLMDPETGLWMNGPDYLSEEYDMELTGNHLR